MLTVDLARVIQKFCHKNDYISLRLDIEGSEYVVIRHLLTSLDEYGRESNIPCHWLNELKFEGHAMYSSENHQMRMVDAVLPWILHSKNCKLERFELETWYGESGRKGQDPKVVKAWPTSDSKCRDCKMLYTPMKETCEDASKLDQIVVSSWSALESASTGFFQRIFTFAFG